MLSWNYRINRWYDDLDDRSPVMRFLGLITLIFILMMIGVVLEIARIIPAEQLFYLPALCVLLLSRLLYFKNVGRPTV